MNINPVVKVVSIHALIIGSAAAFASVVFDLATLTNSKIVLINYIAEQNRVTK